MSEGERIEFSKTPSSGFAWEQWAQIIGDWLPYITLAISTILSLVLMGNNRTATVGTFALAALAAAWVFIMYTRTPRPRHMYRVRLIVYFFGSANLC